MATMSGAITARSRSQVDSSEAFDLAGPVVLHRGTVEDLLVGPQKVDRGDDHARRGDDRPPAVGEEGARRG